jgi:cysteine-rich repeat protein
MAPRLVCPALLSFALLAACGDNLAGPGGGEDGVCGDGVVDPGEECDDGNTEGGDGCSASCAGESPLAVCGNATVEAGEECDDGNDVAFDGCEDDCTASPEEVVCGELDPIDTGVCAVEAGDDSLLIAGDILTPGSILRGGQVLVDASGTIGCVGCDCGAEAGGATAVTCPSAVISPGLINPHDHLTFTHNVPYADTGERYEHRHEWRRGVNDKTEISTKSNASGNQIRWGELRFLIGGATSVIGAGGASGFLRNLDRDNDQQGLGQPRVELDVFPLGDSSGALRDDGCFYPSVTSHDEIADYEAYSPHVSEGINASARNEFICLSRQGFGAQDLLEDQSAFIHGAGLTPIDYARMRDQGTLLIWSPRSNITLYGNTATVTAADRLGVPIALGTDWIPTGSMNMLRELQCADGFNRDYLAGHFSDRDLWTMATLRAAEAAAMDDVIGALLPGKVADIAIFDASERADYRAIIDADATGAALVLRGGEAIYGEEAVIAALAGDGCDALDVCGAARALCTQSEIDMSLAELEGAIGDNMYPLFFCGEPDNEPSCTPARPISVDGSTIYDGVPTNDDVDGDGVLDAEDNCPAVFNPVRPVDGGAQADFDGDGEGDACDECPMSAGITDCIPFDEADADGDGIAGAEDNCPELANPDQEDSDGDGRGDVCDACPADSNPAPIACPATIYEVKAGVSGSTVSMNDQLVTACVASTGYFLQVHPDDAGYDGPEGSGLFVFDPDTNCGVTVSPGDRINIAPSGQVGDFFGQIQLSFADFEVASSGNPLPAPIVLDVAEAAGDVANDYEGILATVEDVIVTDIAPAPGPGDSAPTNEFVVDDVLRVDDLMHLTATFPSNGAIYASITGVLAYRNNRQKIHPRAESDLVPGPPALIAFAPASSFVREGETAAPTFPAPLTVTLSQAAASETVVAITSSDETVLTVEGGGVTVPAGETSAEVLVNGLGAGSVTLTATLGDDFLDADVQVVADDEEPAVVSLEPDPGSVAAGGTLEMTVILDIPAPAGGSEVTLAADPGTFGSVPATVTVAENELAASFDFTAGESSGQEEVTATLGATSASATVTVEAGASGLVINEVDYDQIGGDTNEFIEIFNGTGAEVDLTNLVVVLVNGANNETYEDVPLAPVGTLGAGEYLVIGSATLLETVPDGTKTIQIGAQDQLQNGPREAIGLFDVAAEALIDAISYEGDMTAGEVEINDVSFGTFNFVEGTATDATDSNTVEGSVSRSPNGSDTNDADTDWAFVATPTPGEANAAL